MSSKANVLVVGGGAVGTMTSYALEAGGRAQVTLVLRSNYETVKDRGFSITSIEHGNDILGWRPTAIRNTVPNVAKEKLEPFEYVVVTTKNTPDVGQTVAELITDAITPAATSIVLIQNGLNIEKPLQARYPDNSILSGVQMIGANETSPGVILHNEPDICKLGVFETSGSSTVRADHSKASAQRFVDLYNACGSVDCQFDDNVRRTRWRKLVYNSSYNSVSAALSMDTTRMRLYEHIINDLVKPIMLEILNIAAADSFTLSQELVHQMITMDKLESWCMPSMGQDVLKGNFLEFENIVGEPLREAQRLNVPCPTLTTMYGILKGLQARTKESKGLSKPDIGQAGQYCG